MHPFKTPRLQRPGLLLLSLLISAVAQAEVEDGRYTIVSRHSGLALAVEGNSKTDGANVIQSNLNGATSQQFDVDNLGNGYYSIRPVHSDKSLDVYEFSIEPGGDIRQWAFWEGYNQQWQIKEAGDRHHKILSRHSGLALDVWQWSARSGGDIRQWTDTGGVNQQWEFRAVGDTGGGDLPGATACLASPPGFAAQGNGTTGGAGGQQVTVSTGRELSAAIDNHTNAWKSNKSHRTVIRVNGTINPGNSGVNRFDIKDTGNLSIIGVGNRGVLDGRGLLIRGSSNVIVRNLSIHHVRDGSGDGIELDGTRPVRNVWIDHNTFYNSLDVDKDYYDSLIDGKLDVSHVTLSYNIFRDSWKTSLWGHSDSSEDDRRITFAFNHFDNVYSRAPLLRFGQTHIYNNYYSRILDTGINTRMGNRVRIDNNVFENARNPIVSCYSSQIGFWDARNNQFNNVTWQGGSACSIAGPNPGAAVSYTPPYRYDLLPTNQVKSHVVANAGAGRCQL